MKQLGNDRTLIHRVVLALALVIILANAIRVGRMKEDFFFDEKCTFSFANMIDITAGEFLQSIKDHDYQLLETMKDWENSSLLQGTRFTDDEAYKYMYVKEGKRFRYFGTLLADMADSHPPLYYLLFHTVCSFFINMPLMQVGLLINYICLFVTCFLVYLICKKYSDGFCAVIALLYYGLSFDFANNVTYIRNYAILTMWFALLLYLNYDLFKENGELNKKQLRAICVVEIIAMLTQFYAALFILPLFAVNIMRMKAHGLKAGTYIKSQVVTAVIYLIIWPVSIFQVLFDESAYEVRGSIFSPALPGKLKGFASLLRNSLFAGNSLVLFISFAAVMAMIILFRYKNMKGQTFVAAIGSENVEKGVLILIPTAVYYVFTAISSPWAVDRYEMAIIPEISILVVLAFWYIGKMVIKNQWAVAGILTALVVLTAIGNMSLRPYYLYPMNQVKQHFIDSYSDTEAIVVEPQYNVELPDMFMSLHHPYWTYVKSEKLADFLDEKSGDYSSFVLYINKVCDTDSILDEFAQKGFNLNKCEFEKDFFYVYAVE
ncbi:MAG: glycosyltransferase family 39 protein [Butyrivibrio sp.]|nr:glycosyltransferase family 39 protein [Butyrivibrio sp.]